MDYREYIGEGLSTQARRRALIKRLREVGGAEMRAFWDAFCRESARLEGEAPRADRSGWDAHDWPDRYYWATAAVLGLPSAGELPLDRGVGIDFLMDFRASYEAQTGELLTFPDGSPAEARVRAQQTYSEDGLPPALVQGWWDAFYEVEASVELVDALDRLDVLHLAVWASITHDVDGGWPVTFSETGATTFARRQKSITVNVAWETAMLRRGGYADGIAMVADVVDALAGRYPGLPRAQEIAGLSGLADGTARGRADTYAPPTDAMVTEAREHLALAETIFNERMRDD